MPAIEWDDSYSVNDSKMDAQHKGLFAAINDLYDHMASAMPDHQRTLECVKFLTDYTLTHFADEEALMASIDFAGLQAHAEVHKKLVAQLTEYTRRLTAKKDDVFVDDDIVMFLLSDWLLRHVVEEDQEYAKALRKS